MEDIFKGVVTASTCITAIFLFIVLGITCSINNEDSRRVKKLEEQVETLKKEKKELQSKYEFEKERAEYWYYYNVNDAC